jgi:hypothetical protein
MQYAIYDLRCTLRPARGSMLTPAMSDADDILCLNGIDAATGGYLVPPLSMDQAAAIVRGDARPDKTTTSWLKRVWQTISQPHLGLPHDVDPAVVAQAGWAIVFHEHESDAVKTALEPLIAHRRTRVPADRCHVLSYQTGQTRASWLAANGAAAGSVLPTKVPYYLLLVGGPERFPFVFCHHLDVEYAVGCLHFDTPEGYAQYAASVIDYETSAAIPNAKRLVMFGTRHAGDRSTILSADRLVTPLAAQPPAGYMIDPLIGDRARKEALLNAMAPRGTRGTGGAGAAGATAGDARPPALVFTASHGMGWTAPDARQATDQGALICQDWTPLAMPGPGDYLSAADIPSDGKVHGSVVFHFACYGAGTPQHDRFLHEKGRPPSVIADKPFIAALPKALLAHPRGGALAVIGHVERAWGCSIVTPKAGAQLLPFTNALERLALGQPVGHAMKDFNERYATLSTTLAGMLEELEFGAAVDDEALVRAWVERNDAEGYLVLGDPAVAIRAGDFG